MRRMLLLAAAWAAVAVCGCATALNLQDETLRRSYGGFWMPPDEFFGGGDAGETAAIMFWPLWLLDKPLSLFGDTLALPYTFWVEHTPSPAPKGPPQPATPTGPPPAAASQGGVSGG